ncbi:MAG: hypothetical protein COW54_05645 [Rhodobacteraceae bacterium CG17_big_fil_post_rev_8_21_14_2_50_63_15]|nr:MAG: hypothetical protein COW54_05645 [Rhodobacteraceae bacterium CG17_big_fil_post_rev_8_21_14_2_50_63_15]
MRSTTLALLVTSTALTAVTGLPAQSAMPSLADATLGALSALNADHPKPQPFILVSDDEEDDDDEEDHEDDDEDEGQGGLRHQAPAATVTPPANGLFGNGTPPQVKVN